MFLNIFAASFLLLPLCSAILLGIAYFLGIPPTWVSYITMTGAALAVCNIAIQLIMMRWLLIEMIMPLAELLGFEFQVEKEIVENEDEKAAIFGAVWLFVTHAMAIIMLFLVQMPILGFFSAFGYAVFLLGDWVMHEKTNS